MYNDIRSSSIKTMNAVDAVCTTACSIALENNVDIFVCITGTGRVAKYIAKYKPF